MSNPVFFKIKAENNLNIKQLIIKLSWILASRKLSEHQERQIVESLRKLVVYLSTTPVIVLEVENAEMIKIQKPTVY